ncbi:MAG TPA: T9SS type A sorting domain-containing protein, partial [Flavisolibacter sp.]|nr:T9SS type A sorting domain-containing protein [Flavisolibacter sp.]
RLTDYHGGTPSSFWASGRLPYMATFFASINGITKKIRVVVIHAKSGSTQSDYQRRLYDAQVLKDSLDFYYAIDEVIVVGDYNDRMVQSIYTGSNTSPYLPFVNDEANYTVLTKPLDEAGRTSFPSSNGLIDHLVVSNEMAADYIGNSTDIEDPRAYISTYTSVTASDHLPVYARFELHPCMVAAPTAISGSAAICPSAKELTYSIEPVATATTYTWTVPQGWTITAGQGTTTITVDATSTAGEISVVAGNLCGSSQPAHLTVGLETEKPVVSSCPTVPVQCYVASENYTIPALTALDNCSVSGISFVITGATERAGNGANASGHFGIGTSTITWTVTDAAGNTANCQTEVKVNSPLVSSVPDVFAVQPGGAANTLYKGYGPASLTLQGLASGGTAPYTFAWTAGSATDPVLNSLSSFTVSPENSVTYFFVAKDLNGCAAAPVSKDITVMDIRCGNKLDKVALCHTGNGNTHSTLCVSENAVSAQLAKGAYLGSCTTASTTVRARQTVTEVVKTNLVVSASPNPSAQAFVIQVASDNLITPVQLRVVDLLGRTVETKTNVSPHSNLTIGENYKSGVYVIEFIQGNTRKQVKLWKQ